MGGHVGTRQVRLPRAELTHQEPAVRSLLHLDDTRRTIPAWASPARARSLPAAGGPQPGQVAAGHQRGPRLREADGAARGPDRIALIRQDAFGPPAGADHLTQPRCRPLGRPRRRGRGAKRARPEQQLSNARSNPDSTEAFAWSHEEHEGGRRRSCQAKARTQSRSIPETPRVRGKAGENSEYEAPSRAVDWHCQPKSKRSPRRFGSARARSFGARPGKRRIRCHSARLGRRAPRRFARALRARRRDCRS